MQDGELYSPLDEELIGEMTNARSLIKAFNESCEEDPDGRFAILKKLLPNVSSDLWIQPPFYCDYGYNIHVGRGVFLNYGCTILDVACVDIGSRTLLGPNVQVYTATHPLDPRLRAKGLEYAKPITIGSDVWIGGGAIVLPGVTIGDRTVVGAGSVVTADLPADVVAAGNPCRVIRSLENK